MSRVLVLTGFVGLVATMAWPQSRAQVVGRQPQLTRPGRNDAAAAALLRLAETRYLQGDLTGAGRALDSLLAASPEAPVANDALALLLRCEVLGKDSSAASAFVQAEGLERQGDAGADQAWARVIDQGRGSVAELALLTRAVLLADHRPEEAGRHLERLLREHPETPYAGEARVRLADLLAAQGRLAEAVSTCEAGLLAAPDDARAPQLRLRLQAWQDHPSSSAPNGPVAPDSTLEGSRAPSAPIPR
jgi:tetratricopeptide (TPR) repeat protein